VVLDRKISELLVFLLSLLLVTSLVAAPAVIVFDSILFVRAMFAHGYPEVPQEAALLNRGSLHADPLSSSRKLIR